MKKICIIGGGNVGTLLAAEFAKKEFDTWIYTSNPQKWNDEITVYDNNEQKIFSVKGIHISNDLALSVNNAFQIWIVLPSFMFNSISRELDNIVTSNQTIVCVPGSGGAEFAFKNLIDKGCVLCGLQRVHSIARLKEYGKSVYVLGRKPSVQIGTIPALKAKEEATVISDLLDMPCEIMPNYLTITLTPSNPILHTTRLFSMFKDYHTDVFFDHNILFYEEWTNDSSVIMIKCDEELQELCRSFKELNLSGVKPLTVHYESDTPEKMTNKISHIPAFKGLTSPMIETENGWIPDFSSRYFTADFSFGLKVLIDIARVMKIKTPTMTMVWNWFIQTSTFKSDYFELFISKQDLIKLYI